MLKEKKAITRVDILEDAYAIYVIIKCIGADYVRQLVELGVDINSKASKGYTAFHKAVYSSDYVVVKRLLDVGADIDVGDINNHTALYYCVKNNDLKLAEFLLMNKASATKPCFEDSAFLREQSRSKKMFGRGR